MQNGFQSMHAKMNQSSHISAKGKTGKTRRPRLSVAALLVALGWVFFAVPASQARVNPLVVIERQLHKANMLIVLDTSGSMTGVPGGQFSNATEVGVDCDNGTNCRNGGVLGVCQVWGRTCMSDDECRHGYCQKDGTSACMSKSDCPDDPRTCSVTKGACEADENCPLQTGTCSLTAGTCQTNNDCPAAGKCKYTHAVCNNPGGNCANVGLCQHSTTTTCLVNSDCPPTSTVGNCSLGGTPHHGCDSDDDCPTYKSCQATNDHCRIDTDCPLPSYGHCSGNGDVCNNRNKWCPYGQTCVFPANPCLGTDNICSKPQDTCQMKTDNTCTASANTCSAPANTCVSPATNNCILPASSTDSCVPSPQGTPGPIRMCRLSQTVCRRDSDCTTSGDACGPATSRAVIAKRAISAIVSNNQKMLNFGLMTFFQSGYFPYFLNTSGSPGTTVTVFATINKIANSGCWDNHAGPAHTCIIDNVTMTLRSYANSRYRVRTSPSTWIVMDHDWCGHVCDMPGSLGLGHFEGANYEYQGNTSGNSTTMITQPSYSGPNITVDGKNYSYYQPLNNYYNGGQAPPLDFPDCGTTCSTTCGGRWDRKLTPYFLNTTEDQAMSEKNVTAITQAMSPAANGGLVFYWGTPTGCTLQNNVSQTIYTSAYAYMSTVKNGNSTENIPADPVACRDNYVLLITDGAANGPGDIGCETAACAAANPAASGCTCKAVLAAYNLRQNLGVKTFVVGFSGDANAGSPRTVNDNIARAGGTDADSDGVAPFAFLAQNEEDLNTALQAVIYNAVKGSYSTAPTSTSAGTQQATTVAEGKYALDSRMDFPEWKGHLLAYDLSGASPTLAWDAYQKLVAGNWWQRRIYTWNGTNMVKITVDQATHAITNKGTLAAMGLGATDTEAESVARWLLGDPSYGNPHVLGAIINSTPIDVATPGDIPLPGGHSFFLQNQTRPHLIYVGASDGLLHAFFLENTTIGTTTFQAGSEAFAFLPPDMLPSVRRLYSQGGQKPDPFSHIFGLANSPKAKSMCVQNCSDAATAVWKTLLIMPEGYGGSDTFMLDVTKPFSTTGIADPPVQVQWHTGYGTSAANYENLLGKTVSLPAFFMNKTSNLDDYRVIFTSGYPVSEAIPPTQGRTLITASATTGAIVTPTYTVGSTPSCSRQYLNKCSQVSGCPQDYAALTDVATARDFAKGQDNKLVAAYFGDTSGQLFRYILGAGVTRVQNLGCEYPLHFSPTVVQLDRDALSSSNAHEIFPVLVTNSNLDFDTDLLLPSTMLFWKENIQTDANGSITNVVKDTNWVTGGQLTLTVGNNNEICGVTQVDSQGHITCKSAMPANARPTSTPLGLLLKDASGFQVMTMWYVPALDGCTRGQTYFTIHQISASGTATQRLGAVVANEPVTSPVILGGRIYLFGSSGAMEITSLAPDSVTAGRAIPQEGNSGTFSRYSWSEVF
jgi:hypothetical protein